MPVCLPLPAIPAEYEGVMVRTYSVVAVVPTCETAGQAFFDRVERHRLGCESPRVESSPSSSSVVEESPEAARATEEARKKKNYKENSSISQRVRTEVEAGSDLYKLICLDSSATADDIKKQWRKLAMVFHPDKSAHSAAGISGEAIPGLPDVSVMTAEELHEQFLKRHNAFEILSDPVMRKQYDSYTHFDDRLPTEHDIAVAAGQESMEAFFNLCGPAFEKESRWCVKQPVPSLGDADTPIEDVKQFYKYWANYESWREFANAGEFNLEEAQDREERKWMQRENWKVVKGMLKAERQRVLKFVTAAEAKDPRLALHREKLRQAKAGAAQAKAGAAGKAKAPAAKAKAKSLQDVKAAILARRKKLADGRFAVRQVVREWIVEKLEDKDEVFQQELSKYLGDDNNVDRISDLCQKLSHVCKRYKEPTTEGATELKSIITEEFSRKH